MSTFTATFYLTLRVTPTRRNLHFNDVDGAFASCWVRDNTPESALVRACFKVRQYDWDIVKIEDYPTETTKDDFIGRDIGLKQYVHAQESGIAMCFAAAARDGKSRHGPFELKRSEQFDLARYLSEIKKLKRKGRCLHYDAGNRCSRIIDAHSIQKNGSLSVIQDNGHVYSISRNFGDFNHSLGGVTFTKQGIDKISTFRGFCKTHDNQVFKPIDTAPLVPTRHQILLYAYRALCRELFVKEYALILLRNEVERSRGQAATYELFDEIRRGTEFGLNNLLSQKQSYDESLSTQSFSDMKSVVFCTDQKPTVVFSGLFCPDFDFQGRQLQDLSNHSATLDLLTFSSVPMDHGWGVLLAWHSKSSGACVPFVRSLATRIHEDKTPGDHLFRLVISSCENMAMSPAWWESLPDQTRSTIENGASHGANIFAPGRHNYLAHGLENISGWTFDSVISDMD